MKSNLIYLKKMDIQTKKKQEQPQTPQKSSLQDDPIVLMLRKRGYKVTIGSRTGSFSVLSGKPMKD